MRVKWQTAVIMSAGQHSRERNFFQSLGHGSGGGEGGWAVFSALKLIGFIFLLWVLRAVSGIVTKQGEFSHFLSTFFVQ